MIADKHSKFDTIIYHVRTGDSLSAIICKYYGTTSPEEQQQVIRSILTNNPQIKNANLIYPGQVLTFDIPQRFCSAEHTPLIKTEKLHISSLQTQYLAATPKEKNMMSSLIPIILGSSSTSLTMIDKTFKTNTPILSELVTNYSNYKDGKISKGQYSGRRIKAIKALELNLGPTKLLSSNNKPLREVLRISRMKGASPTHAITQQMQRMGKLSKIASNGGVALSAVSLGLSCYDISKTQKPKEKNEIFVEAIGGLVGSLATGGAATLYIVSMATPVGWVATLVIGAGVALTGYATGKGAKYLYTTKGAAVDLTRLTHVDQLCR